MSIGFASRVDRDRLALTAHGIKGQVPAQVLEERTMKTNLESLEEKLKELDEKIAEVNKRMPAHSVKPPIMMQLFELEDERDTIVKKIEDLKK